MLLLLLAKNACLTFCVDKPLSLDTGMQTSLNRIETVTTRSTPSVTRWLEYFSNLAIYVNVNLPKSIKYLSK